MAAAELPEDMLDEVSMIMHLLAEMGAHPEAKEYSEKKRLLKLDLDSDSEGEDVVDCPSNHAENSSLEEKEKIMIEAGDMLARLGDSYDEEQRRKREEQSKLISEIADFLCKSSKEIDDKYGKELQKLRPKDLIFDSGVMGSVYSYFRTQLSDFLGVGQGLDKIALVSHITKGVAGAVRDNSSHTIPLTSVLSSKFITDNYGSFIKENGGLAQLVSTAKETGVPC